MNSQDYIEVRVRLAPFSEGMAEILTAEIAELPYDTFVTEEPLLKCYIQKELYRPSDLKVVLSGYDSVAGFEASPVPAANWNRTWEERFSPIVVDGTVTIKAPQNGVVPRTRFNIWIDPAMAFGTGSHHTTYMMMQAMLAREDRIRGHAVLDMGCGTAILGILAAKMGARKVWAIDIDAVAARSAWGNARWNPLRRCLPPPDGHLRRHPREHPPQHHPAGPPDLRPLPPAWGDAAAQRFLRGGRHGRHGRRRGARPPARRPTPPRGLGLPRFPQALTDCGKLLTFANLSHAGVLEW